MKAWIYIVECSDGSYYTGATTDLEQRIYDHNNGIYDGYTSKRLPVRLLWSEEFVDIRDAAILERQIKGWTRAKKEALMSGDMKLLHRISVSTSTNERIKLGLIRPVTSFDSACKDKRLPRSG